MRHPLSVALTFVLAAAFAAGCNCGQALGPDDPNAGNGADGGAPNDGGNGQGDGGEGQVEKPPFPPEQACHEVTSEASLTKKSVDIIMVIDNSCSMTAEIEQVEANVNVNFAEIIAQSGVDYRVILVAKHGSASGSQSVCIRAPLSGDDCDPIPPAPVNGARFFHYDIEISSTNPLSRLLSTYGQTDVHGFAPGGWRSWLRADSAKTFIVVTDDESAISADAFEDGLFALDPAGTFGTAEDRQYVLHSIIGILAKDPVTAAYAPDEPVVNEKCASAARAGPRYEELSKRTGGLRFPVCETGSYDAVFQAAAQDVIASAEVACEFTPPPPPEGRTYDQAYVEYTPGDGSAVQYFLEVPDAQSCNDRGFTRNETTNRITLCPDTCAKVKADPTAALAVRFACNAQIG